MAFSDLCHISNAYKAVENEVDQSERIMEENSMVRDLITKILDETGPTESSSSIPPSEKTLSGFPSSTQYPKNESSNASYMPSMLNTNYQNNLFSYSQPENSFGNFNMPNGFSQSNGFPSFDNDVNSLLNLDSITDVSTDSVTPEQLNLLRLAAQEIGGAQFTSPNKYEDKYFNFFEPNQRNSLPDSNMFPINNYNRPNSLNMDASYNPSFDAPFNNSQRFPNKYDNSFNKEPIQDNDIISYLSNLNISMDRPRDEALSNNIDFKMPDMNSHYHNEDYSKLLDDRNKMYYNRNYQQMPPNKNYDFYANEAMPHSDRNHMKHNYDFSNQTPVSVPNSMNFKPNGYHGNDFMCNQMMGREGYPMNGANERGNFENNQQALMRQNQEIARQMSMLMRNRPPPHQLNVDVSFLHENTPFNLGLGALLGPSPPVPPPVLPSPMLDLPLLAPFYALRNMRGAVTSSSILHARLDACYEQWRQLERERKRTEARLALAYPGRAVSSSNSIPVPRLPPCPTRVDRLTVDMLREHTKVLTLMGKMETLRASVCVAQNKKPHQKEDSKITVLKRGQENIASDKEKEGLDPETFDPASWKEDIKNLAEIAPHSEVEAAMLAWRGAVCGVQAARRRELAAAARPDPILQLADGVKQLCIAARRARCAMWCDLTLTVALAPQPTHNKTESTPNASSNAKFDSSPSSNKQNGESKDKDKKEDKPSTETTPPKEAKPEQNKTTNKQTENSNNNSNKNQQTRRSQNYRKVNNSGRNDFYQKRYDNRFMHNRHPYYLATGPIN